MAKKSTTLHEIVNELVDRTNSNSQRLRALEERDKVLSSRANAAEQEMLDLNRQIQESVMKIDERAKKVEERAIKTENMLKEVVKQIKKLATTSRISELEQLIEVYNPIKSQFVTREEVERLIEERKNK